MERQDRDKLMYLEDSLSLWQSVWHKSHVDWPGIKAKSPKWVGS